MDFPAGNDIAVAAGEFIGSRAHSFQSMFVRFPVVIGQDIFIGVFGFVMGLIDDLSHFFLSFQFGFPSGQLLFAPVEFRLFDSEGIVGCVEVIRRDGRRGEHRRATTSQGERREGYSKDQTNGLFIFHGGCFILYI